MGIVFRKAFRILGLGERKGRWAMEQDFHGGAKVQVTGHRLQATGHRSGHRSGYRPQATDQVTGHTKNNRTLDKTVLD